MLMRELLFHKWQEIISYSGSIIVWAEARSVLKRVGQLELLILKERGKLFLEEADFNTSRALASSRRWSFLLAQSGRHFPRGSLEVLPAFLAGSVARSSWQQYFEASAEKTLQTASQLLLPSHA